jgi:cell division protein FtsW
MAVWMARSRQQPLEHRLLLTATFCLLAGGAVMVYSASSARTLLEGQGDGTAYLVKYLMYGGLGLVVMQLLARHGLERVRRYTPLLLLLAFVLLLLVLVPGLGVKVNGAEPAAGRCSSSRRRS